LNQVFEIDLHDDSHYRKEIRKISC